MIDKAGVREIISLSLHMVMCFYPTVQVVNTICVVFVCLMSFLLFVNNAVEVPTEHKNRIIALEGSIMP